MNRIIGELRSGRLLSANRVRAYAQIFLGLELLTTLFITIGTYGLITPLPHPVSTDFVSFYAAGYLTDQGHPGFVYDRDIHYRTENLVKNTKGLLYNYFFYPPIFLLICAPLARLPYLLSFAVFEGGGALLYIAVLRRVIGKAASLLPYIAFPAFLWTIGLGQNSLLTAALLTAATLNTDRRPILAGLLFGCLAFKPHFGLLVPIALIASRNWRAFFSAFVTVVGLVAFTAAIYGYRLWADYFAVVLFAQHTFEQGRVAFSGLVSPFGAVRLLGGSSSAAYVVQILASLLMAIYVAYIWSKPISLPVRAAALCAAIIPSVPVILFYDLMIAAVAIAWMVVAARRDGFLPWEKAAFCLAGIATMYARGLGIKFYLPIGPLAELALLAVIWRRAKIEMSVPAATAPRGA